KRSGFADESLAALTRNSEERIRRDRPRAAYKMVDTCGGEFEARTPYFYSTYEATGETPRLRGRKVLIVGSGPVRIGQGVEFDYCCVQGIFALREEGVAAIIANNNPETVSTDFDISTRLYFEPLLLEDFLNSFEEVRGLAARIGYPVLVRPSYVLGGRGMEIVYTEEDLAGFMETAVRVSKDHPVLVDRYLAHATEIDVDVVADGRDIFIGGIQEHIEEAGIHSGDAACVLPAQTLSEAVLEDIRTITRRLCKALHIVGLMNLQLAVQGDVVYVLEANPRASRTVPYVSKAIGISLAKVATKVMLGHSLRSL